MRNISSEISPAVKLVVIGEVCYKIEQSVLQFWQGVQIETEKIQLTADDYVLIMMYVILKAGIKDLEAQMFLIEQFTDDFTLNVTKDGYFFLTVKQALQALKNID